jgi:hypothetical protein
VNRTLEERIEAGAAEMEAEFRRRLSPNATQLEELALMFEVSSEWLRTHRPLSLTERIRRWIHL